MSYKDESDRFHGLREQMAHDIENAEKRELVEQYLEEHSAELDDFFRSLRVLKKSMNLAGLDQHFQSQMIVRLFNHKLLGLPEEE